MTRRATLETILGTANFFKGSPGGRIKTGIWHEPYWNHEEFRSWFLKCLDDKINRNDARQWRKLDECYQRDLRHDSRIINDYARRIRWPGRNLLRTKELRAKYLRINVQMCENL